MSDLTQRLEGALEGRSAIDRQIGEGGMGVRLITAVASWTTHTATASFTGTLRARARHPPR